MMNSALKGNMDENDSIDDIRISKEPQHKHFIEEVSLRSSAQLHDKQERSLRTNELLTTMSGLSGSYGSMFDIESISHYQINIKSIDIHVSEEKEDCAIRVYFKEGTHIGFEDKIDAWTMVVNGSTHCRGFEKRTIIPAELFTDEIKIAGGKRIAFYITLSIPRLRYSKPTPQENNEISDSYIIVHEGTGVGGLFEEFFYPRIFNGVIKYEPIEEKHISLGGDDDSPTKLGYEEPKEVCQRKLETKASSNTSMELNMENYGNMFNIGVKGTRPVYLQGLEFYTSALNKEVEYFVYTLSGGFQFGMYDMSKWSLVATGKTTGKGKSMATSIPPFNLMVPAGIIQGLYVTLSEPAMLNFNSDLSMGENFVEDEYSYIRVGLGVDGFPLTKDTNFPSLAWNGALIYSFPGLSCDEDKPFHENQSIETTLVFFNFIIKHKSTTVMKELSNQVESGISSEISTLLITDEWLSKMRLENNMKLEKINSSPAIEDMSYRCKHISSLEACATITTQVSLTHQDNVDSGRLIFAVLNATDQIMARLEINNEITEVINGGDEALETETIITLNGVPKRTMGFSEQEFYESITEDILNHILQVEILNVQVLSQSLESNKRHLQVSSSSIDITTVVTGKHKPPPEINFDEVINDAVNNNVEYFRKELIVSSEDEDGSFFSQVTSIKSQSVSMKPTDMPSMNPLVSRFSTDGDDSLMSGTKGILIMVGAAIAVFGIVFGLFAFWKQRKYAKKKARNKFEDDKLFANLTGHGNIYDTDRYLDADVAVMKSDEEQGNDNDDCATTTDMTFDSKTSHRSEIRDALRSQESYSQIKEKRKSMDFDESYDYDEYDDEIKTRPPRVIGLGDSRGSRENGSDEPSEITFNSGFSRKTKEQLEQEYQDRMSKKMMNHTTPEFSGNQDSYNRTLIRRSMLDISSRDPYMIEEDGSVNDSQIERSRQRIDDLEAEYETRLRKKLDPDTVISDESSSRRPNDFSSRKSSEDSISRRSLKKEMENERRANFRRKSSTHSNRNNLDISRKSMKSFSRNKLNLDPKISESKNKRCEDPPADFFTKPFKFVETKSTGVSSQKNRYKNGTIISAGTNSTLSSKEFDL